MKFSLDESAGSAQAENKSAEILMESNITQKVDFVSPSEKYKLDQSKRSAAQAAAGKDQVAEIMKDDQSKLIDNINNALEQNNSKWNEVEDVELSEEEQSTLEQILFQGYAQYDIPIGFKDRKVTVVSQSPLDHEIIEVCMKRFITSATMMKAGTDEIDNNESLLISEGALMSRRQMYSMAMFVVGFNGEDICKDENRHFSLKVLKAAYKKALTLLSSGKIQEYRDLLDIIIGGVNHRATIIMEWGNLLIDTINERKFEYENRLFKSLDQKRTKAVPKS